MIKLKRLGVTLMPDERRVKNVYVMNSGGIYTYTWF
jgi:hypothetical protein